MGHLDKTQEGQKPPYIIHFVRLLSICKIIPKGAIAPKRLYCKWFSCLFRASCVRSVNIVLGKQLFSDANIFVVRSRAIGPLKILQADRINTICRVGLSPHPTYIWRSSPLHLRSVCTCIFVENSQVNWPIREMKAL